MLYLYYNVKWTHFNEYKSPSLNIFSVNIQPRGNRFRITVSGATKGVVAKCRPWRCGGRVLWLNVYRMTREGTAPPRVRNGTNLFSLARLSSHTGRPCLFCLIASPLKPLLPSIFSRLPPSKLSFLAFGPHKRSFFLSWPLRFPSILPPLRPLSHGDKAEVLLGCAFAAWLQGFVVGKWGH